MRGVAQPSMGRETGLSTKTAKGECTWKGGAWKQRAAGEALRAEKMRLEARETGNGLVLAENSCTLTGLQV